MLGISVDGAAPIHTVTRRIGDDTDDDVGNASGSGIITLGAESSQDLKLYVKNPASAEIFIVKHAQVVMTQLKQAELGTFGEMYYSAGTTHQNKPSGQVISTSFTKLTDFNSPGNLKNVTYSSNALTVGSDGNYLVCLTMSFWGDEKSSYTAGISVNNSTSTKTKLGRYFPGDADLGAASCYGIFTLTSGQNISVMASEKDGDKFYLTHGNLSILKLETATEAPYASMGITSETEISITNANTNVSVPTTSAGFDSDTNYWSFSSSSLSPVNAAAGYYLVNYSMSMT